jgi:hypothetical protein
MGFFESKRVFSAAAFALVVVFFVLTMVAFFMLTMVAFFMLFMMVFFHIVQLIECLVVFFGLSFKPKCIVKRELQTIATSTSKMAVEILQ